MRKINSRKPSTVSPQSDGSCAAKKIILNTKCWDGNVEREQSQQVGAF